MAEGEHKETPKKRRPVMNGSKTGKNFTTENQPSPEAKSLGWQERRKLRLLTQEIIKHMAEGNNLTEYVKSLIQNAKHGNPKAIETVNKGIEDDIIKIEHTGKLININIESDGNSEPI